LSLSQSSLATGFGCHTAEVNTTDELTNEFKLALDADGPTVIVVHTQPELPHLG
jgi:benzoylformate decarboxylase